MNLTRIIKIYLILKPMIHYPTKGFTEFIPSGDINQDMPNIHKDRVHGLIWAKHLSRIRAVKEVYNFYKDNPVFKTYLHIQITYRSWL